MDTEEWRVAEENLLGPLTGQPTKIIRGQLPHVKFSEDTTTVGCVEKRQEGECGLPVDWFAQWSGEKYLQLNVMKMMEMVADLRRSKSSPSPVTFRGTNVEIVQNYKYK